MSFNTTQCDKLKRVLLLILTWFFQLIPEGTLKNRIRCWKANRSGLLPCTVSYDAGVFRADFGRFTLTFLSDPCSVLSTTKLYLKHYQPAPGEVVIDGGAHIGALTLILAKLVGPTGTVVAYEPEPSLFDELSRNLEINALDNVIVVQAALWSQETTLRFQAGQDSSLSGSVTGTVAAPSSQEVAACSLDDEIARLGLSMPTFIKLNIEGGELPALLGARKLLKHRPIHLAVSTDHLVDGELTYLSVEPFLREQVGLNATTEIKPYVTTQGQAHYITTYATGRETPE